MLGCKMFLKKSGGLELEEFYPVRPECRNDVPKPRFRPRTGKTLSVRKWESTFSGDGHLDIARVLRRIQLGGVHPAIKGAVWEFLLGCFDPNSTSDERNKIREQRREQYSRWKAECQKMAPIIGSGRVTTRPIINEDGTPLDDDTASLHCDGSAPIDDDDVHNKRGLKWKLMVHQIGLDVVRTDRALEFYETEANQAKLFHVLAVYAWMDEDTGYVQGMSDICSPMVILLENEADAFWCFERAMRRLRGNFRCTSSSIGVQSQLSTLSQIMRTVDPKLHQHLEDLDGGEYLFAFRMLMVLFRREFSFVDALYLWELIWAMEYNPKIFLLYEESRPAVDTSSAPAEVNKKLLEQYGKFERKNVQIGCVDKQSTLAVFLAASILEAKNKKLLKEAKGLDDVVKILGDMTGKLDAKKACNDALKIHKKYLYKTKQS